MVRGAVKRLWHPSPEACPLLTRGTEIDSGFQAHFYAYNEDIRDSYSHFLHQFEWHYFITQTFRSERRDPIWAATQWYALLANKFMAERAFIAVEPHKLGGIHLHALTWHVSAGFRPESLWKYLYKAYGRNTVEVARSTVAVTNYCAKYTTKAGYHYEVCGDTGAWVP